MRRPWVAAAGMAALTSLVFIVVYNVCNRLTALRPDVGVWAFGWERSWPLIPAMIVPYWSLDAFYVLAPFSPARATSFGCMAGGWSSRPWLREFVFWRCRSALLSRGRTWKGVFAPWFAALYGFDLPQLARLAWPWTFLFLWPAFALAVAALARIYRKGNGQLTWLTRILLAPLIAGQWLSQSFALNPKPGGEDFTKKRSAMRSCFALNPKPGGEDSRGCPD